MVIIHMNLVIKRNKRNKEIRASSIMLNQRLIFLTNLAFWSRFDSYPLWGKSSTINFVSSIVVFFVKLISFMVKNIKGKFRIRIRIITSMLVW